MLKDVIHKSNRGGRRIGAGRKKGDVFWKKEVFSVRLNQALSECLDYEMERTGKTRSELIQDAIYKQYHIFGDIIK